MEKEILRCIELKCKNPTEYIVGCNAESITDNSLYFPKFTVRLTDGNIEDVFEPEIAVYEKVMVREND